MNNSEAFGLPPGSVRAILALILTLAVVLACFLPNVPATAFATLGPLAGMAITAYFGKDTKQGDTAVTVTGERGSSTVNVAPQPDATVVKP